jgi:hypothetical protein
MHPDPQRNARLQAKINFPISGKRGFFLLLANTLFSARKSKTISMQIEPKFDRCVFGL